VTHVQELIREVLDGIEIQRTPISVDIHIFLQILFTELFVSAIVSRLPDVAYLENKDQFRLGMNNIM
jgi:hypothetical protein